ncbi:hypothetical protein L9F63_012085, partial [Diploptera punctata]
HTISLENNSRENADDVIQYCLNIICHKTKCIGEFIKTIIKICFTNCEVFYNLWLIVFIWGRWTPINVANSLVFEEVAQSSFHTGRFPNISSVITFV